MELLFARSVHTLSGLIRAEPGVCLSVLEELPILEPKMVVVTKPALVLL